MSSRSRKTRTPSTRRGLPAGEGPTDPEHWITLGEEAFNNGDMDGAFAAFQQAIAVDPDCADALNDLGVLH